LATFISSLRFAFYQLGDEMTKVAFIGLGRMGGPMAVNLAHAGYKMAGFDLVPALCESAREAGISIATSAPAAVDGADVIITMLPTGEHVLAVLRTVLPSAKKRALFIDCSTIDVANSRAAHALAAEAGLASVDAPVSGGTKGAAAGTLTFMCGAKDDALSRATPILEKMGQKIIPCGAWGAGQAAKICNNMILGVNMIVVAEAFVLAEKLGLSAQALYDVVSTSSGKSHVLTSACPVPGIVPTSAANNGFKPGFTAALMGKDLKLSQAAAESVGARTPLGAEAADLYAAFIATGHEGDDFSAIINFLRR
jgi:3-hydroxyisobutyrate dehydrogenase